MDSNSLKTLSINPQLTLYYQGPSISEGKLPALFYFALSAEDSLCKDPFNQPVQFLSRYPIRIFSLSLPGHGTGLPPEQALSLWADDFSKGEDPISPFLSQAKTAIDYLFTHNLIDKLAVAGLSRGGFIASHLAALEPRIELVLQFAPLTKLELAKEFAELSKSPILQSLSLTHISSQISNRTIRFYIGNRDTRVSTRACFEFFEDLVEHAYLQNIRSPKIEMVISPSVGYSGHGTSPTTFQQGVNWLVPFLIPSA